jgi:hypothetical protein
MNFPRFHVFVDADCLALTSGKITSLVAPSKLVAMLTSQSTSYLIPGSEASTIIREWRKRDEGREPEVQIVIEGELMTGFLLLFREHIHDIYQFENARAIAQADHFARLDSDFDDFICAVNQASDALDKLVWRLEDINPETLDLDISALHEAEAKLSGGHAAVSEAIDHIAERFVFKPSLGPAKDKKAA